MVGGGHASFERARNLAGQGRLRSAHRACDQALRIDPDLYRALALKVRLEAQLGVVPFLQAKDTLQTLIEAHPTDSYLRIGSAVLTALEGDRPEAIAQLRATMEDFEDDPHVHQTLGAYLNLQPADRDEAWFHFRAALESGPLQTPAYKAMAFATGKRIDPMAKMALRGTGLVERHLLRTWSLGIKTMVLVFGVLAIPGVALCYSGHEPLGFGLIGIPSAWALWCAWANSAIGCWKCVLAWVYLLAVGWGLAIVGDLEDANHWWVGYVLAGALLVLPFVGRRSGRKRGSGVGDGNPSSSSRSPVVPVSLAVLVALTTFWASHASQPTNNPAIVCAGPTVIDGSISSVGQHDLVDASFKPGTSLPEASQFVQRDLEYAVGGCIALTEITSDESGVLVLHVLGSAAQGRLYRSFIMSYLERSGRFSYVLSGKGKST
jgi:hypothetical protein